MCGRYTLFSEPAALAEQFGVAIPAPYAPRYNIAPSQPVLVVRSENDARHSALLDWGLLPSWSKDPRGSRRPINARAETVAEKPSFRTAFRRRRCLVPADGYYEWSSSGGAKQPWFIRRTDQRCFAIAGLWEYWQRDGAVIESCCLLTCAANPRVAGIHHRMPVIIEPSAYATWLGEVDEPAALARLLSAADDDALTMQAVSKRVNSPANDGPECIQPEAHSAD